MVHIIYADCAVNILDENSVNNLSGYRPIDLPLYLFIS